MSRLSLLLAAVISCWSSSASAADWLTVHQKDEFDGKDRYLAVTSATEPWMGFVCEVDTGRFKFFYKTGESAAKMRKVLPIPFMKIALIVDDDPVRMYPGSLEQSEKKLASQSYDRNVIDLALIVSRATRRVLVANELGGNKYHQHEFSVDGAHRAISMLLRRCAKL
jgi:hypothetical protein